MDERGRLPHPGAPLSGLLASPTRDLVAHHAVGSGGGLATDGGVKGGGGDAGFAVRPPLLSAGKNTPASPLTDQDLCRSEAWLGNCRPLAGMMAGLSLPACHHRPVVFVMARESMLLGHGMVPKGASYADASRGG